jgi:anti-sigma factor RsiW
MNMPDADAMTCQELVELVTDYLEDALDPPVRDRFEAHLHTCAGCRTYVEQMRTTIRLTGEVEAVPLSPEACETLLRAFRTWKVEGGGRPSSGA